VLLLFVKKIIKNKNKAKGIIKNVIFNKQDKVKNKKDRGKKLLFLGS
jgi:hypothetical protein